MFAAITGFGCICAAGSSIGEVMMSLYSGKRNPAPPKKIAAGLEKLPPVFEIEDDLCKINSPKGLTRTNRLLQIALEEALKQADINREQLAGKRVGVIIGTTVGCTMVQESVYRDYKNHRDPHKESLFQGLYNNPALYISKEYGLSGPATSIVNACSSGTDAIGMAKGWIDSGLCDMVIAGGTDELSRTTYLGFNSLLNTSFEACRPFDKERKGLNLGEGAGVVIVENSDLAAREGRKRLGSVAGYGSSGDAYHPTAPHPAGAGLIRATMFALKCAGLQAEAVSFINAHGTSTVENDKVEGKVIRQIFSDSATVVSTKSYTGHTLGAAGAIEAVLSLQALLDGRVTATAGYENFDEECGIAPTTETTKIKGNIALSNSLAFGGNNSVLLLKGCA
ncbi:MAG: beta-ketoacyl-[acyl-carrier-protein] synthase family protein [bacterium]|nr:beta-ketoacyl-[acyl-carrier-protein] synthase family protein [bacterium]